MEKVKVYEVAKYCWDCPKCGHYNVSDNTGHVMCDICFEVFESEEEK